MHEHYLRCYTPQRGGGVRPCSRNKDTNPDIKTLIKYQAGLRQLYNFTN